ncbi:hypothetical protein L228DRAFT_126418 [Xylona heveae TC161]|uniref:C2H2-type domain-containing protein n=1 Tax=Xylona heveae (strain CBS 132557 / TC161) TaxID=1328760 RepID=A0A161TP55_XYLHT|nr:hypothetical protein L228DRAFT_126418 [Xylona heveae TC161]KZF23896.1 hypothetical protein L228DRAFT_126418 [Xylona heveae TC161]
MPPRNHEKCHEKPYGCTFPDCPEAYKSRRKWKAHENNEHWIPKSWRCRLPTDQLDLSATLGEYNREECAKIMHTREGFWKHLQSTHGISSRKILVDEATACFIGDKGSDGFWCGFCREIKPRSTEDFAAWDERLDHVQAHIDCEHRLMDEWVPVDKARTKGEIFAVTLDVDSDEDSDEDCSQSIIDLHLDDPWPLRSSYTDANAPCVNHQLHEAERDPDLENQAPKKRKRNF